MRIHLATQRTSGCCIHVQRGWETLTALQHLCCRPNSPAR
uniref:Uncharacterized protein n=1 Tax=Siphoviridae sp. ct0Ci105 TaxID=2825292 RepID=A0A8S5P7C8_9CAUD|nr:MAG TPA: hypothetical protein [Siphoviridae sp. ct0Ci105]